MSARARSGVDVLVIGAGAAGLAAAREVSQAGLTATVLEARPRIGGRVYTLHAEASLLPLELGAEFIHGEAEDTFSIVRAARLLVAELPDDHYQSRAGKLGVVAGFWEKMEEVGQAIAREGRKRGRSDLSFSQALERLEVPSPVRQLLLDFVEGYHAAHPDKISARFLAADEEPTDPSMNRQFRIVDGYDRVVRWMRSGLDPDRVTVRLSTIATEVAWSRGEVVAQCRTGSGAEVGPVRARAAIVTIPHAVLRANVVRFVPPLESKRRAAEQLEAGQVFKIVLGFRAGFWEEESFVRQRLEKDRSDPPPLNFVHSHDAEVPTWWTALPFQVPLLTGWAGGPKAESLLSQDELTRVDRSLTALAEVFGVPRRLLDDGLESWWTHDWRADPWSQAAYTYPKVGGINAQKALAAPLAGTLFFAGEATDPEQTGTVAGAIGSGRRAGRQTIRALGGSAGYRSNRTRALG